MNFFNSVFSDDPDPPKPESESNNADPDSDSDSGNNTGGDTWNFGGLIKTLTAKSESIIETYRRDLQEFSTGLKTEIEVAQGSVGHVIDEFGNTVIKGTAQIISHGKDAILAVNLDSDSDNGGSSSHRKQGGEKGDAFAFTFHLRPLGAWIENPHNTNKIGDPPPTATTATTTTTTLSVSDNNATLRFAPPSLLNHSAWEPSDFVSHYIVMTFLASTNKDGDCLAAENMDDTLVGRSTESPHREGRCGSASKLMDNQVSQDLACNLRPCSAKRKVRVKREDDGDNFKLSNFHSSPISDLKINEKPADHSSDIVKVNEAVVPSLSSCKNKVGDVDISSEVAPDDHSNKPKELPGNFCHGKQEVEGSKGSFETLKEFSETKDSPDSAKDPSKSEALGCLQKMPTCVGKSSPASSTMNSKSLSQNFNSEDAEIQNSFTKQRVMVDCNIPVKNESSPHDAAKDENPKKFVRERSKSSLHSNSKGLHSSRSLQNSVSKQAISEARDSVSKQASSEARDSVHCSSSKASSGHQTSTNLGSSETNASLHQQKALQVQNKISSVPPKVEKANQTNIHSSSKSNQNHVPTVNPSPTSNSSMLSDEELALLLHQELNSSPRVPRVPRARNTGSLPQLNSTSATSMLMKRTTSAGGKDHYLVSRRKYKDASRDGFCSSREPEDEAKIEKEKGPSSSDQRKQNMECVEDTSVKEGGHASVIASNTITNNVVSATSAIANSSPHSPSEEQSFSLIRNSPRNISDDDTATAGRPVHHTLPGLINDIMSSGKRMTYEELCNAVLPHWHNLRKHNGERYAYSSHSQAVLDCLRNRHEWARLVDRGPKTNTNRKRRKLDAEESDDSGYGKGRTAKEVEGKNFELQKEEFPKGKRKARKRRRLALHGRAVNDVRRRQKADSQTDEDVGPFSNSSEESIFSEDEIQNGRTGPAGSTSDEAGSA